MAAFIACSFAPRHPRDTYRRVRWFTNRLNRLYDLECALLERTKRRKLALQGRLSRRTARTARAQ